MLESCELIAVCVCAPINHDLGFVLLSLFYSSCIDYVPFTVELKFQVVVLTIESAPWLNDELVIKRSIIDNKAV